MRFSEILLYPFACIYGAATAFRNRMFDLGLKKSQVFEVPTVVVGNLAVGGTGKTPFVEFLLRHLSSNYRLAVLSRGYGRKTRGFIMADDRTSPQDIGDEPAQMYSKFKEKVKVAVGEERILAIPMILAECGDIQAILLDDAYQHRYLEPGMRILLTTYSRPFFTDRLLPLGRLRESRTNAARADVVVVTKCPLPLSPEQMESYVSRVREFTRPGVPIYFAGLTYGRAYALSSKMKDLPNHLIVVTGIVDPIPLVEELSKNHTVLEVISFPDHHRYSLKDFDSFRTVYDKYRRYHPAILTTEKDAVKMKDGKFRSVLDELPIFVKPVEVLMDPQDKEQLLHQVAHLINEKQFGGDAK
ncbi:tetraacyldisaccharide 4'-kinase [Cyclobacterium jeungdonense]|uniref:Tetraacyldisaccharide 4'-kinase n=1 Tax=Cyclobacterium jeungdonense TaxID=708087 RepID=A0ABT8C923_9BACT|nr:tetraacyldisaccharide 4'-kinase [Cyclobacterium jeungdonense]MDN3689303.1 tetraacyldisaccharide 4'-kinase [Cyclobacterium jeungdonense]